MKFSFKVLYKGLQNEDNVLYNLKRKTKSIQIKETDQAQNSPINYHPISIIFISKTLTIYIIIREVLRPQHFHNKS